MRLELVEAGEGLVIFDEMGDVAVDDFGWWFFHGC